MTEAVSAKSQKGERVVEGAQETLEDQVWPK